MPGRLRCWFLSGIVATSVSLPAIADDNPMVDELRALAEKSRQENAADRWLQRALENLIAKYDNPWKRVILEESFIDGDYTHDPRWDVLEGQFRVDASLGLISRTRNTVSASSPASNQNQKPSDEEIAGAILGALLQGALGGSQSGGGGSQTSGSTGTGSAASPDVAMIRTRQAISNAFSIASELSFHAGPQQVHGLELALFQSSKERWGYRLKLTADSNPLIELERVRRGRAELISSAVLPTGLANGAPHQLSWTQSPQGQVQIALDGTVLIQLQDKAFRDAYQYLVFANRGGDVALRNVVVKGTP